MPKISVVIITRNEERNIERCILSVKDVADEIVVVDSYSTDRTEEICRKYNVHFIQHIFEGYINQKNFAMAQAEYDHILSLDADEALSPRLNASILSVKENWKYDGYYFNRLTSFCGQWIRHSSWYPARKLRLFDRAKGQWGGQNPHDQFFLQKNASSMFLKGDLLHYSYYSIREHIEQINRFSDAMARSYFADKQRVSCFTILFRPLWRFFRDYFIRAGFLDGFYGLVICVNSSHETFLKYAKLHRLIKDQKKQEKIAICFINSTRLWGGGEKWHYDIATRLHHNGYRIVVVTNRHSALYNRIRKTSIQVYNLFVSNLSFRNPFKVFYLARILKKEKVGTIIINLSADLKLGGIAARIAGVPNIIYRRGLASPIRNSPLNRFLFRKIITEVITNSEETKRTVLKNNPLLFDPHKISVIYNGIDLVEYNQQPSVPLYQRENDEIIIGNAGRLVKQKAQHYLIDLAAILKKEGRHCKILIAGEGSQKNELMRYAHAEGVEDRVVFLGFVKNMKSFMDTIDIFCLTSLWEGFGYVLVEAMACGKPVVAFNTSSNPEIVKDGKTGFLVPVHDVQQMAIKLDHLIIDEPIRKEMGANGKALVESVFDINYTLGKVKEIINRKNLFSQV